MTTLEILALLSIIAIVWYWFDGLQAREIAIRAGTGLCQKQGVYFLDDSVAMQKVRLRRNSAGQVVFYREYRFEFTSDGAYRSKGKIRLMGRYVVSTEMDAYRQNVIDD